MDDFTCKNLTAILPNCNPVKCVDGNLNIPVPAVLFETATVPITVGDSRPNLSKDCPSIYDGEKAKPNELAGDEPFAYGPILVLDGHSVLVGL